MKGGHNKSISNNLANKMCSQLLKAFSESYLTELAKDISDGEMGKYMDKFLDMNEKEDKKPNSGIDMGLSWE